MNDVFEQKSAETGNIRQFAIKTVIVAIAITACTVFTVDWVIGSVEDSVTRTIDNLRTQLAGKTVGGSQFWGHVEQELDRAANPSTDLPPQTKQKLISDLRAIVARWRPFIDAVQTELQKPASSYPTVEPKAEPKAEPKPN